MKENSSSKGEKMNENSSKSVNSSKNSKVNSSNSATNSNSSMNSNTNSNFKANLKAIFTLPKWAKVFLAVLSVVAVAGLITAFSLKSWAADKVESGELVLNGIDKGWQWRLMRSENFTEQEIKAFLESLDPQKATQENADENLAKKQILPSKFAFDGRLYFARLDFLLRSKVIAYIDIQQISWGENVDKNAISDISSHNRHIKFITSQDLQGLNAQNIGQVEYKMDFSPLFKTIIKYYFAIAFFVLAVQILWNFFVITWRSLPPKIDTAANSLNLKPLTRKDYAFLGFAFVLCAGICAFTFWLGFPGYHLYGDIWGMIGLGKNNAHPVFISYILEFLYFLFGKHTYYLFLFNLIPFYLGLFFLIASFYIRFRSPFAILLIFPTFIGNVYFPHFVSYNSHSLSSLLFCMWALLLFLVLVPLNANKTQKVVAKFLWIFLFVLMFFAILWRHNPIFVVYPAFFVLCYIFLKDRYLNAKTFLKQYIRLATLSAILCLFVVIGVPKILTKGESYPANHTFLHQIAGACVPANDASCFKNEWYRNGRTFEDAKIVYEKYPLAADPFGVPWTIPWASDVEQVCKSEKLHGLYKQWIKAILKHPYNYLKHNLRFIKATWTIKQPFMKNADLLQTSSEEEGYFDNAIKNFPKNEWGINFSHSQRKIYTFLYDHQITFNTAVAVSISFILMVICSVLLSVRKFRAKFFNTSLIFAFSVSLACFCFAIILAVFTPIPGTHYIVPIFPLSLVALIGFFAFVLESLCANRLLVKK